MTLKSYVIRGRRVSGRLISEFSDFESGRVVMVWLLAQTLQEHLPERRNV